MLDRTGTPAALRTAAEIADDVLFPAALATDAGETPPVGHLDLLAREGFYGLAAPPGVGTLDLPDFPAVCRVIETLAGGCLTTTFVWAQHHSAVMAAANSGTPGVREAWLEPLATGTRRAGLAMGAVIRPGPPQLAAKAVDGGYVFTGSAPWISGWGAVDTLYTAARDENDTIVWALLDAAESPTLSVRPLRMVGLQASATVTADFDNHPVPAERITALMPLAEWVARDPSTLRFNGSLALGLAGRAIRMLDSGPLADQLDQARDDLDQAGPQDLPAARAAASELALRACAALAVHSGSRAVLLDQHAQRLMREATFLLVFGSRPGIRDGLLDLLSRPRR